MIKINGTPANALQQQKQEKLAPTLSQILDRMESNYNYINYANTQSLNLSEKQEGNKKNVQNDLDFAYNKTSPNGDTVSAQNFDDKNSVLLSILPSLLNKSSGEKEKNILIGELLKNSKNPTLAKLMEVLPKLTNINKAKTSVQQQALPVHQQPKIDSFIKTDDYK